MKIKTRKELLETIKPHHREYLCADTGDIDEQSQPRDRAGRSSSDWLLTNRRASVSIEARPAFEHVKAGRVALASISFTCAIGLFERPAGVDDERRAAGFVLRGPLRRDALARFLLAQPSFEQARELHLRRTGGDDDPIEVVSVTGFVQQRHVDDGEQGASSSSKARRPAVMAR